MRSRTELVTTTFIDSEDDFTETDDSEEDWRPSASTRNVKKRTTHSTKGRTRTSRKRKSSGTSSSGLHKNPRRQAAQDANYQTFDDSDDEDDDDYEYYKARTQLAAEVEPKAIILPPKKKEKQLLNSGSGVFQLFLYRKDLKEDYMTNPHLCLWRKDGSNLLQKYIRVKTGIPDEFIFTSSSVYSTWDEKRRRDFLSIAVKCLEENNRRVTFVDTNDLHTLARTELERVSSDLDQTGNEIDIDIDADIDADGSDNNNSGESECEDNDGSYHPDEEEAEVDGDDDIIDEIDDDDEEQLSDEEQDEFEDYGQMEEEEDDEEEDDNVEVDDNENENEADHN